MDQAVYTVMVLPYPKQTTRMTSIRNFEADEMTVVTIKINAPNFITDFKELMVVVVTEYKFC